MFSYELCNKMYVITYLQLQVQCGSVKDVFKVIPRDKGEVIQSKDEKFLKVDYQIFMVVYIN